jgi:hypothetical protein
MALEPFDEQALRFRRPRHRPPSHQRRHAVRNAFSIDAA